MRRSAAKFLALAILAAAGCARGRPAPAQLDPRNDLCAWCRMPVSDRRLAAQIVRSGEEPKFFDDLGCLRDHLSGRVLSPRAAIYVADHRTGAWVSAEAAVYTRCPAVSTPMGSHLLAHADAASRDHDPAARAGEPVTMREALGPSAPAGGGNTR
jgi:copper chaperone NosL